MGMVSGCGVLMFFLDCDLWWMLKCWFVSNLSDLTACVCCSVRPILGNRIWLSTRMINFKGNECQPHVKFFFSVFVSIKQTKNCFCHIGGNWKFNPKISLPATHPTISKPVVESTFTHFEVLAHYLSISILLLVTFTPLHFFYQF